MRLLFGHLIFRHLTAVSLLVVFSLTICFWRETDAHATDTQRDESISGLKKHCNMAEYSCNGRCGKEERNDGYGHRCFCDELCSGFGDCCFDFDALCPTYINNAPGGILNETCLVFEGAFQIAFQSVAVWNKCPQNWTETDVRQKCQDEDQSDLISNLPVFDKDRDVTYRNIFCARCNGAPISAKFWKIQFNCNNSLNATTFSLLGNETTLLPQDCWIEKFPDSFHSPRNPLKQCIPRFQKCRNTTLQNGSRCETACLRYAFPVCSEKIRFRNPHCALCAGFKLDELNCTCNTDFLAGVPSLTMLFDFTSTSKYSVVVQDRRHYVFKRTKKEFSCRFDEVYDPYAGTCKKTASVQSITVAGLDKGAGFEKNQRNKKRKEIKSIAINETDSMPNGSYPDGHQINKSASQEWDTNCTSLVFNKTEYVLLSNGSVYLKPHKKTYNNMTFKIHDHTLLLCVNFSRNYTRTGNEGGKLKITKMPASLQLLTLIGCIVSMVFLVLLLITYLVFAELRNLPGKIIINLTLSVIVYQSVFFLALKKDNQETCLAIAVLLHFFILSSFTWMNVMAYDVHRIFTNASEGVAANRQNQQGGYTMRLMKYCIYAWGSPLVIVVACIVAHHVRTGSIGYGQGEEECFISQPQALLYSFVLPVALVMIYNIFALGHTVVHIVKTRKGAQNANRQQHGTSVALICVKMASVMGISWILGIAANLKALSFFWYPYVVLNSLQGLFIFLSFAASGKALELYKSKLAGVQRSRVTQNEVNIRRKYNCYQTDGNQLAQDTRL